MSMNGKIEALIFYVIGLAVVLEAAPAAPISTETIYDQQRYYDQGYRNREDHRHHSHHPHRYPHGNCHDCYNPHHHLHGHRLRDNSQYYSKQDPPFCASCGVNRRSVPQYFAESSNGQDFPGEIYGYQRRYTRSGEPSQFELSSEVGDVETIDDGLSAEPIDELIAAGDLQAVDPSETFMYVVRPFDDIDATDLNDDNYSEDIVPGEEFTAFPISMKKVEAYPTRMFTEKEVEEIVRTAIKSATEKRRIRIENRPEMQEVRRSILPFDRNGLEPANVVRRPAAEIRRGRNSGRDRMNIPKMLERMDKLSMRVKGLADDDRSGSLLDGEEMKLLKIEQLQTPNRELGDDSIVREGDIVLSEIGTEDELNENDFEDNSKPQTKDFPELQTIGLTATTDKPETVDVKEDSNIATTNDVTRSSTSAETLMIVTTSEAPMTTIT